MSCESYMPELGPNAREEGQLGGMETKKNGGR